MASFDPCLHPGFAACRAKLFEPRKRQHALQVATQAQICATLIASLVVYYFNILMVVSLPGRLFVTS